MGKKIAVIGAGSSYTPELLLELDKKKDSIQISDITLMDLNDEKLTLIGSVYEKLKENIEINPTINTTSSLKQAVTDVDFIILQIRVGGLNARIRDETVPMEFNLVGNETTGAGGFVCALRTIPVAIKIAQEAARYSPKAYLLNLSNPAGIVTEALLTHGQVNTIGFCNIPVNTTYELADFFQVQPEEIQLDSFGLNHLSWTRGVYVNEKELLQPFFIDLKSRDARLYKEGLVDQLIEPELLSTLQMLPSWYLRYFYYPEFVLSEDQKKKIPRGEEDKHSEQLLKNIYSTSGFTQEAQDILKKKGGAQYYLPVVQVIKSIINDSGDIVVVDTINKDSLPDLPQNVCVEVPAKIFQEKVEPLLSGPMPLSVRGLVQTIKTYEQLTINAAINGDRKTAIAALMANPLIGTHNKARLFFERVLEGEKDYISEQFYQ